MSNRKTVGGSVGRVSGRSTRNVKHSEGPRVRAFIEQHLVHSVGDQWGQPFVLRQWQADLIDELYELDLSGRRRWRRALIGLPKGNGKTELAAALALYELFTGDAPIVPVAAANFEQADLVFGAARSMVTESPTLSDLAECYETEIKLRGAPGRLFRVAAIGPTNDGMRPTMAVFDELHEVTGPKERMHLVISNGLAKRRGGFELNITTAGVAGTESLCELLYRRGMNNDPSLFFDWRSASPTWDLTDPEQRRQAVMEANPAAGDWLDPEVIVARFDEIPANEWCRYHLNSWTQSLEQWLPLGAWEALASPDEVAAGESVVLGFDGSYNRDSTALVGVRCSDGYVFVVGAWENPGQDNEWRVSRTDVEAMIEAAFDRWNVVELAFDPPGWHRESEDWAVRWGDDRIVQFPTQTRQRMVAACSRFFSAVTMGELRHDGNSQLAAHLRNAMTKPTPYGTVIVKDHKGSPRKIDLAVAAVVAFDRATQVREQMVKPQVIDLAAVLREADR